MDAKAIAYIKKCECLAREVGSPMNLMILSAA